MADLILVADTREKEPYDFPGYEVRRTTLTHGDYSAYGLITIMQIERKSVSDLVGTLLTRWQRFRKKMATWKIRLPVAPIIMVDGDLRQIYQSRYVQGRLRSLIEYRLCLLTLAGAQVYWTGSREASARMTRRLLELELRSRERYGRSIDIGKDA